MNFRRRLSRLECIRPWHRPVAEMDAAKDRAIQRKLNLPLPVKSTPEEYAHALALMQAAQKIDGESGWLAVRDYATSLHRKYKTQGDN